MFLYDVLCQRRVIFEALHNRLDKGYVEKLKSID